MNKRVTVAQFIGHSTNKYRTRYRRLLFRQRNDRYQEPSYSMPRADHCFTLGPFLVSRPYSLFKDDLRDLIAWADQHGLDLEIGGPTSWHPATVLVLAVRSDWLDEFWKAASGHGDAFEGAVRKRVYYRLHSEITPVYTHYPTETGIYILNTKTAQQPPALQGETEISHYVAAQPSYTLGRSD